VWPDLPKGGSIDDAPGTAVERVSAISAAITERPETVFRNQAEQVTTVGSERGKRRRLAPDEVMQFLPELLKGTPRFNVRTRAAHVGDQVITANQASRLYLTLSDPEATWPKEATADALMHLAEANTFDPVADFLTEASTTEALPMQQWERLDQLLLNIDDPLAADFLPRYLIGAVARVLDPGCHMRQLPVLIGGQDIGKSETARTLFGPAFFNDQLSSRLDVDDVTRLHRHWCTELGELDGITRRTDQEALKAFISRRVDVERRKYGRSEDEMPRRSVFWGTSNGAPLRDPTGSSRFVCIAVPNRDLPLERVKEYRQAIWSRAVQQYRAHVPWFTDAEERQRIADRNAGFEQQDPWLETVRAFAEVKANEGLLPLQANDVLERLEIPLKDRNNVITTRVRQLLEQLGWQYARRRTESGQLRGFWPPTT
ncbi:MAG: hypothetical protein RLZZ631_1603, partial [Cyanobacteriota bacterium]|jgi:predicted P-loop ATPase